MASPTPAGSSGTGVVGVEIVGSMRAYLASLQETGKLTKEQTQAMAKDFAAMAREVQKAQKVVMTGGKQGAQAAAEWAASLNRVGAAARGNTSAVTTFGRQIGDVGTMAAMGAPPLQILASQAEQLAFSFGEAGGVTGILSSGLGAVLGVAAGAAVQIGLLYVAIRAYNADAEEMRAVTARVAEGMNALAPIMDHTRDATIRLKVATGELTEVQGDQYKASRQALERFNATTEATRKRLSEVTEAQGAMGTQMVDRVEAIIPAWTPLGRVIDYATTSSYEYEVEQGRLQTVVARGIEFTRESVKTEHDAIAAEEEAKQSKKDMTAARKAHEDQLRKEEAALRALSAAMQRENDSAAQVQAQYQASISSLYGIADASRAAAASELERIDLAERAAKAEAEQLFRSARDSGSGGGTREEAERAYQDALTAIEAEAEDKRADYRDKMRKKEEKADKKALDLQRRLTEQSMSMVQDIGGKVAEGLGDSYTVATDNLARMQAYQAQVEEHLTTAQKAELEERVDQQRAAAMRAFEAYKAAQLAQAAIGAASAFVSALDDAPYPANLALAALSAGAAAIPIAAIASEQPSFHTGGPLAPDEISIRAQAGEWVSSKQGRSVIGDDALRKADAGVTVDTGGVYLVNAYRHTPEVSRYEADRLNRNGPYARAVRGSSLPGMR